MYRNYENPYSLENQISELKQKISDYEEEGADDDEIIDLQLELAELEERLNFAWQDDEFEEDYNREYPLSEEDLEFLGIIWTIEPEDRKIKKSVLYWVVQLKFEKVKDGIVMKSMKRIKSMLLSDVLEAEHYIDNETANGDKKRLVEYLQHRIELMENILEDDISDELSERIEDVILFDTEE